MTTVRRRKHASPPAQNVAVMGIDQSYSGFAITILFADGQHRTVRACFDAQHSGKGVDRLNEIGCWFRKIIYDCSQNIEHVCMEGYAPGAKFSREILGELAAVVKISLRLHPRLWDPACYPTIVAPVHVKQFATGKAQSKKDDMKLGVYKKWGVEFDTNDEADSYTLARVAAALAWGDGELVGYQNDVLKKLRQHTER